jgi:hypothetical protein
MKISSIHREKFKHISFKKWYHNQCFHQGLEHWFPGETFIEAGARVGITDEIKFLVNRLKSQIRCDEELFDLFSTIGLKNTTGVSNDQYVDIVTAKLMKLYYPKNRKQFKKAKLKIKKEKAMIYKTINKSNGHFNIEMLLMEMKF